MTDEKLLEWYDRATAFHTKRAPGLLLGAAMIDACLGKLGPVKGKINAVSESVSCLCDIIQLMTGCTLGNRYLKVYGELGRYAFTLFDRDDGKGVRAFIDLDKISASETPELHKFFLRQRSSEVKAGGQARLDSGQRVVEEFLRVRERVIGLQDVFVNNFGKENKPPAAQCPDCRESFLQLREALKCGVCGGEIRYFSPR